MIDGSWSEWSEYSACDVTCGNGSQTRERQCVYPDTSKKGSACEGDSTQNKICSVDCDPVTTTIAPLEENSMKDESENAETDGSWSSWGEWSACSSSCGNGLKTAQRECNNPSPSGTGDECEGASRKSQQCSLGK